MKNIIQLIVIVIFSCIAISLIDYRGHFQYYYFICYFTPGVLFSIFIISNSTKDLQKGKAISSFILLNVLWLVSLFGTLMTWGFLSPIFGAFSAWFIARYILLENPSSAEKKSFLLTGGISSLIGLVTFFLLANTTKYFSGSMIGLIAFWQITIGIKILRIKQIEKLNNSISGE